MGADAYQAALRMLARRELSEMQLRLHLRRRGFDEPAIDAAVTRLKSASALDDVRVAGLIARSEATLRKRGRLRVRRRLEAAGIAPATAQRALDETFSDVDEDALLRASLEKRLRGRSRLENDKEFQRLYRYLTAQGFDPERVLAVLRPLRQ